MIRSLLWKEFRLATPAFLTAALLFVASFVSIHLLTRSMTPGPFPWLEAIIASTHFCQWSMVLVAALLGGGVFAGEREDQSALFVRALPIRSRDALLAKLVVTLLIFECLWMFIAIVVHASVPFTAMNARDRLPGAADLATMAGISFAVYGSSWAWSTVLSKPILAALNGVLTTTVVLLAASVLMRMANAADSITLDSIMPWSFALGIVGVLAGAGRYLAGDSERGAADSRGNALSARSDRVLASTVGHGGAFGALLWKDWRLGNTVLMVGMGMLAAPYLFSVAAHGRSETALESMALASTQSLWLSCVVYAVWGGYIVAAERASKTDRFLYSLPITPERAARSRLLLTFAPAAIVFGFNVGAMLALHQLTFRESPVEEPVGGLFRMTWPSLVWQANSLMFAVPTLGMPLLSFGVAWFGSARIAKPFLGIGLGVAAPGLVLVCWLAFITIVQEALLPMQAASVFLIAGAVTACWFVGLGYRRLTRTDAA